MRQIISLSLFGCTLAVVVQTAGGNELAKDWPQWRGPGASGVAVDSDPPTTWSETKNVKWKIKVPGAGSSSPIILGDRVYVSTAVKTDRVAEGKTATKDTPAEAAQAQREPRGERPDGSRGGFGRGGDGQGGNRGGFGRRRGSRGGFGGGPPPTNYYDFIVLAYDRASGEEVWRTSVTQQVPHEGGHSTNTFASSSPVTDGERLYMSFGSRGLFCLDLNGKQLWDVNLGQMQTRAQFGEGSSPAVHNGMLVVPWDHEGESFIVALDAKTGDEKWRQSRDERTTWSTPLITGYEGRTQVITNGSKRVRSYDLATGELIWECGGQTENPIPSPVRFEDNDDKESGLMRPLVNGQCAGTPLSRTWNNNDEDIWS